VSNDVYAQGSHGSRWTSGDEETIFQQGRNGPETNLT
jgi:hypothetical protein